MQTVLSVGSMIILRETILSRKKGKKYESFVNVTDKNNFDYSDSSIAEKFYMWV